MKTREAIIQEHKVKVGIIADNIFNDFEKSVEDKSQENVNNYMIENEKRLSAEVVELTVKTLHENRHPDMTILADLRNNYAQIGLELGKRIQASVK